MNRSFEKITFSLMLLFTLAAVTQAGFTVATFDDPATGSSTPLFTVNWTASTVVGGWSDEQENLDLVFTQSGNVFEDAWFSMSPLNIVSETILGGDTYGVTTSGQIDFYADGTATNPLMTASFTQAMVSRSGLQTETFFSEDVTFTGSQIAGTLYNEQFSFSFANVVKLMNLIKADNFNAMVAEGYVATAAFTSSAAPEPATLVILGLGGLILRKRN
ncbi:MAG: PEP-CTERM sorting domain-containing protein [Sedimentisphaerales bacterium]|nr:PEP-CTERM sorting domain-containing protein [Sedimentisphaerales bacterium]